MKIFFVICGINYNKKYKLTGCKETMPDSKFLEEFPLYKKFNMGVSGTLNNIEKPAIHMFCKECNSAQTFVMINRYEETKDYCNHPSNGEVVLAEYRCAKCDKFRRHFLIKISEKLDYIMKVGQYLPWEISIEEDIGKILLDHAEMYKKGLTCESQGYGIGAYAYYRRIIESIIDELLDCIKDLINETEKETYSLALEKTKKAKNATEKINLVKDLLPPILRPGNINPLATLHDILSQGLHEKSEEECLQLAKDVKETLLFLAKQIINSQESSKRFTESMKKLLDKKRK